MERRLDLSQYKRIAFLSPGFLPVPSILGGAVESLMTNIIEKNEFRKDYFIDCYTINIRGLKKYRFYNTNIKFCGMNFFQKIENVILKKIQPTNVKAYQDYYIENVIKRLEKSKYDLIIVENNMDLCIKILEIKNRLNSKVVFHAHNDIDTFEYSYKKAKTILEKVDKIWTVSEYIKKRYMDITDTKKVDVYKNCIDVDRFDRGKYIKFRKEFRAGLGIPEDGIVILFSGRLIPEKGVLQLIKAYIEINRPNIYLIIIGSHYFGTEEISEYEKEIKSEVKDLNEKVFFLGNINYKDIAQYYSISEIVVVPSLCQEAAGLVVLEAEASENNLIVNKKGGIPEYCSEKTALQIEIEENDYEQLVRAITDLIDDREMGRKMILEAKKFVKNYGRDRYFNGFVCLVDQLLSEKIG